MQDSTQQRTQALVMWRAVEYGDGHLRNFPPPCVSASKHNGASFAHGVQGPNSMRMAGRITNWNDEKGFGFVMPHDGGPRAFVHVKAFQTGSRRPAEGDLISYDVSKDAVGRTNATSVRFAGQRIEAAPQRVSRSASPLRYIPRVWLGLLTLSAIAAAAVLGWLPVVVSLAYFALSFATYLVYWRDKDAAGAKEERVPENTLHMLDLLGGWPGALIAQQQFRHKTVKPSFQATFWITVLLNVVGVAFALRIGAVQALIEMLPVS